MGVLEGSVPNDVGQETAMLIFGSFSLFLVVVFCKVPVKMESVNAEPLLPGRGGGGRLDSCKPWVTTFLSADQYIPLFYGSFCFETPYLLCIMNSLMLNSWAAAQWLVPE